MLQTCLWVTSYEISGLIAAKLSWVDPTNFAAVESDMHLLYFTKLSGKSLDFYFLVGIHLNVRITNYIHINCPRWLQYIPRNMHTVFALLCFVVVIHWLIFPYPSGLLHWHCGNLTIAPVPAKQPWWIGINTSCEFIMNDCITTTKQSTTKPCAYFLGYTVFMMASHQQGSVTRDQFHSECPNYYCV